MAVFEYDQRLVNDLISRFGLRKPNADGLDTVVHALSRQEECEQVVLDIATGVGKTWLLAALLEYAAAMGVKNLLVVLPGKTVRTKTIANFTRGAQGFIDGAEIEKIVITPQNFIENSAEISDADTVKLFLMNVHHLVQEDTDEYVKPDSARARNLKTARPQEMLGEPLLKYLEEADDLFVVLDESHRYAGTAATWSKALDRLKPAARVGLTATPVKGDNVIFEYPLQKAIADKFVKTPVIAHRRAGYRDGETIGQLKDAKKLLERKAQAYRDYEVEHPDARRINPIMLVTCQDTEHADEVAGMLIQDDLFTAEQVLVVHSNAMNDAIEEQLARVQEPDSPVRVIVQVSMLNEGWNVHNVAVLVPVRALESGTLTEQLIGRGLRLPYGEYTGDEWIDSLDILSHQSIYDALRKHGLSGRERETAEVSTVRSGERLVPPVGTDLGDSGRELPDDGSFLLSPGLHAELADIDPDAGLVAQLGGGSRDIEVFVTGEIKQEPRAEVVLVDQSQFAFPLATFETTPNRLELVDLDDAWHKRVAATVGTDFTESIDRETIVVTDRFGTVRFEAATQVELYDEVVTVEDAQDSLEMHLRRVPTLKNGEAGALNRTALPAFVRRFTSYVEGEWNIKRIAVAVDRLKTAVNQAADDAARQTKEKPRVHRLMLPRRMKYELAEGRTIESQHDVKQPSDFILRQNYDGWLRNRFSASQFDSYSAEFKVARLLDVSEQIDWWMRLEQSDGAKIEYGAGRSYYPDFIARDLDGVHWIIEGKDDRGRDDEFVQAKRSAAERVLRIMDSDPEWQQVRWGYLIAYEGDLKMATTWTNLKHMSDPKMMIGAGA